MMEALKHNLSILYFDKNTFTKYKTYRRNFSFFWIIPLYYIPQHMLVWTVYDYISRQDSEDFDGNFLIEVGAKTLYPLTTSGLFIYLSVLWVSIALQSTVYYIGSRTRHRWCLDLIFPICACSVVLLDLTRARYVISSTLH